MKSETIWNIHDISIIDSVTLTVCNWSHCEDLLLEPSDDSVQLNLGEDVAMLMPFTVSLFSESFSMIWEPFCGLLQFHSFFPLNFCMRLFTIWLSILMETEHFMPWIVFLEVSSLSLINFIKWKIVFMWASHWFVTRMLLVPAFFRATIWSLVVFGAMLDLWVK